MKTSASWSQVVEAKGRLGGDKKNPNLSSGLWSDLVIHVSFGNKHEFSEITKTWFFEFDLYYWGHLFWPIFFMVRQAHGIYMYVVHVCVCVRVILLTCCHAFPKIDSNCHAVMPIPFHSYPSHPILLSYNHYNVLIRTHAIQPSIPYTTPDDPTITPPRVPMLRCFKCQEMVVKVIPTKHPA